MLPVNLADMERAAQSRIEPSAWDYYRSGANDEQTLRDNVAAYARHRLHYRVLVDVSERDLSTTVQGSTIDLPIVLAPTAFQKLAHPDGELGTVRAAGSAGTVMILSTLSNTPVERVVEAASGPVWFQLYVYRDREATEALVRRVFDAGCEALVLTVDAPLLGRREADVRNRFSLPGNLRIENMLADETKRLPQEVGGSGLAAYFCSLLEPSMTWKDLEWLRSLTRKPIWVKGIVHPEDARLAIEHGASGVIVSNHGGRQLDGAPATIDVLAEVAQAVAGRGELILDGGIRRGTDIVKALALGARAVGIGRPVLWGLGLDGQRGVTAVLDLLRDELSLAMALCGCPDISDIAPDLVRPGPAHAET